MALQVRSVPFSNLFMIAIYDYAGSTFCKKMGQTSVLLLLAAAQSAPKDLPTFLNVTCPEDVTAEMCVDVRYADGSSDMLLMLRPHKDAPTVLKGMLKSHRPTKVVIILQDQNNPEATVSRGWHWQAIYPR